MPRIAVVGAGYFAPFHLEGWQQAGAQVVALCDLDAARAQALALRFGIEQTFADVAQMLNAVDVDLVDVVLPPQAQAAVVRAALDRRRATICQKPFGRDLADAGAMTAWAEAANVPLVVHENFRFTPWFRESRRLIDAGLFGRLYGLTFRLRPGDGQGPRAYLARQPYFQQMPQLLVRETAVHFIDTFRYLCGEVLAVTARLRRLNPVIAGEDAGLVIFEFDDDRMALFDGNRLNDHVAANPRRTLGEAWIEGEAGVLRLDGDARLWWKPHHGDEAEHSYERGGDSAFGGACTALQAHVLAHLHSGAPLENQARDYLVNLQVQAAIYHSHDIGARVSMAEHLKTH
jgi:predicted dehydrogenase